MSLQSLPKLLIPNLKGPRLNRSTVLQFRGDWGQMNLHRVCCWLSMEFADRAGSDTRTAIWNGRGGADSVVAVARGEVDVGVTTPDHFAPMALTGAGPYGGETYPYLRAIGKAPQDDRLVLAIKAEFGIRSFADLREKKPALKIATSPDDGLNLIGFSVQRIMEAAGISRGEFESWGGEYLEFERPHGCFDAMNDGSADGIFHEAIMTTQWQGIANDNDMSFIPLEEDILDSVEKDFGFQRAELKAGYFRGLTETIPVLDFSDFLLVVREDMPEDIAHLLTWCLCETRESIERTYAHIPPERSPLTYPLVPAKMARPSLPLHAGAERYYREAGII